MSVTAPGRLRRVLARFSATSPEHEAEDLLSACSKVGATPVAQLDARERSVVRGTLRTVTVRPRAGVPALMAELYDGSGTLCMIWLGRRSIPGIEPGREIVAKGLVCLDGDGKVMYNPRYELQCPEAGR